MRYKTGYTLYAFIVHIKFKNLLIVALVNCKFLIVGYWLFAWLNDNCCCVDYG